MKKILILVLVIIFLIIVGWFGLQYLSKQNLIKQDDTNSRDKEVVQVDILEGDVDRDGISDEKEKELGTSDFDFDTDGDAVSDKLEIEVFKTNPTKRDTDGDGKDDGLEIFKGTDPLVKN